MTDFLLKSTASLLVFLTFYHLVLERENTHHFKRFYLLFTLIISITIPFITFEIIQIVPIQAIENTVIPAFENNTIPIVEKINYVPIILWILYSVITTAFVIHFAKNIWKLYRKTKSNGVVQYKTAKLVLLQDKVLPHSFLNYIFLNKQDYENQGIEDELYTHELVHVNQKHTLDILFVEFMKAIFWFNPLFYFYKKAIQLNHEFLADEKVVHSYNNVVFYQNLLLKKSSNVQTIYLASNLNYLVTKKRLIMMTKNTSQKIAVLKKIAVVPILAGLIYFFCIEVVAKEKVISVKSEATKHTSIDKDKIRDNYYSGIYVKIIDERINRSDVTLYENLSLEDKRKYLDCIPEKRVETEIPAEVFEKLKNENNFVVIDGKKSNNEEIKKYNRNDFSYYTKSSLSIKGKKNTTKDSYALYTKSFFDKNIKNSHLHFTQDTVKIVFSNYRNFKKDAILKKSKIDTLISNKTADNHYDLHLNDTKEASKSEASILQEKIYEVSEVDEKPEFVGGTQEFYKFVATTFILSDEMKKGGGKVFVSFIVEKDGTLSTIKSIRDFGLESSNETIRVLKLSPNWKPGKLKNKPVRVHYTLPITISQ